MESLAIVLKVLITGNLGYVGTVLSSYLKKKNHTIYGLDSGLFFDLKFDNLKPEIKSVDHQIYSDLRNLKNLDLQNIDAVIHLAAISNDPMGNEFENVTKEINFIATKKIIDLCVRKKVKKFVFASSCSMYGNFDDEKIDLIDEKANLNPLTAYAKSKVKIEKFIEKISKKKTNHTLFTCLRFSTACGPSNRLRLDLVLNDFVASAIVNKKIELLSDGKAWRPLIDVRDMSRAFDWGINRKKIPKQEPMFVNIGNKKNNVLIKDLAHLVRKNFNNKVALKINSKNITDKRSYKVNFNKFYKYENKKFYPKISILKSINDTKNYLQKYNFSIKNFRNSNYIRLVYLKKLIANKVINKKLYFNERF